MASSPCDQKKAEIVRLFQKQCIAETETVKAMYDLECLQVKENYNTKVQLACDDLREQELKELAEKKRIHNAKMGPIKARHALELAEIQQQYRTVGFEPDLSPSALAEALDSMTAVEAGKKSSTSSNDCLDDSEGSSDESDNSIPAGVPKITKEATTKATFALLRVKRQRRSSLDSRGGDHQIDDEPNSSQSENEEEQDDSSDFTFQNSPMRPPRKVPKTSKRAPAQTPASSAPPESTKKGVDRHGDESMYSDPASQGPRRGTRRGRPEPGKYVIKAATFPKYNES